MHLHVVQFYLALKIGISMKGLMSVSYFMVCAYIREDNQRALARGLSPEHMYNHTITALLHQHACALCVL